jgi:hypothetical protein
MRSKGIPVDQRRIGHQSGFMWSAYTDDDPGREARIDDAAQPGLAPKPPPGENPVALVVDGENFVVSQRAGTPGTYDFDWVSHPHDYGFATGGPRDWVPDEAEMVEEIRSFLSQVDPETGYLED